MSGSLTVNNGETMRQLALAGLGIARLGQFHVEADLASGALVELLEEHNPGDLEYVSAVYVGGGRVPARVRAFIDHMAEHLAAAGFGRSKPTPQNKDAGTMAGVFDRPPGIPGSEFPGETEPDVVGGEIGRDRRTVHIDVEVAEIGVAIFGTANQIVGEGVFGADADGPAGVRL